MQNTRFLSGATNNTPILVSLHWLPEPLQIHFKILLFVFNSLSGCFPRFSCVRCYILTSPSRSLRLADQTTSLVTKMQHKLKDDRAFTAAAPCMWNNLPSHFRQSPSLAVFNSCLQTHFYAMAFDPVCSLTFTLWSFMFAVIVQHFDQHCSAL